MPTDVTKTIGITSADYPTPALWFAACPANLVTSDQRYIGQCLDQGEFVSAGVALNVTGITTDATRYIILQCGSGASFRDKAGVRTTALDYNASNGVAIRVTGNYNRCVLCDVQYTRFDGLQLKITGGSVAAVLMIGATHCKVSNCIAKGDVSATSPAVMAQFAGDTKFTNSLIVSGTAKYGIQLSSTAGNAALGCTIIRTTAGGTAAIQPGNYTTSLVQNNAAFGWTAFSTGVAVVAGSGFNGTDNAIAPGSSNQTSLTFSAQFVSSTNDFRAVVTGSLDLNGTPDATNLSVDISNTARSATTPTIGAWEVVAAGGGTVSGAGSSSLTFSGTAAGAATAAAAGSATLTFAGSGVAASTAAGAGTPTLTFTPAATGAATAATAGTSTLTLVPAGAGASTATFSGAASLTFTPAGTGAATAAASGTTTLTFAASSTDSPVHAGSGMSSLAFTTAGTLNATTSAAGTPSLTFSASGGFAAVAAGTSTITLNFAATGTTPALAADTGPRVYGAEAAVMF